MNIKPLKRRIVVRPDSIVEKTDGGLFLPDYSKKRQTTGTVMAVGKDVSDLKVGDRVLYGEFAGAREVINETEMFIMEEADVIAKEVT